MKKWLTGIRGAFVMVLAWAIGWGLVVGGGVMELFVDPSGEILDIWPAALAIPGLVAGVVFCALVWVAEDGRGFDELSLPRLGVWGLVTGLLVGVAAFLWWVPVDEISRVWLRGAVVIGAATLLSVISAVVAPVLFRFAARLAAEA